MLFEQRLPTTLEVGKKSGGKIGRIGRKGRS